MMDPVTIALMVSNVVSYCLHAWNIRKGHRNAQRILQQAEEQQDEPFARRKRQRRDRTQPARHADYDSTSHRRQTKPQVRAQRNFGRVHKEHHAEAVQVKKHKRR
jgi:hypothetical protein